MFAGFSPAIAEDTDPVKQKSPFAVGETLGRLETVLKDKGITVMARVDHGKNAEKVDMELRPTQLRIFGKPEHGTQLMQQNQAIGGRRGLDAKSGIIKTIGMGLEKPTGAALQN